MVYIANQWKENSPTDVRIFSNAEEVELFVNDKSLGRQKPDDNPISSHLNHPPFTFKISEFHAGTLKAKAYVNSKEVANHIVQTPQQPTKIEVELDLSGYPLDKNNEDIVFVYAKILDENNTLITDYEGKIKFKIEGNAELIGKNPTKVKAGIASILLKSNVNTKDLKIEAKTVDGSLFGKFELK